MIRRIPMMALLLAVLACSSDDDPTDLDDNTLGSISARIDGTTWTATSAAGGSAAAGAFAFHGSDASGRSITVVVAAVPQAGAQAIRTSTSNNLQLSITESNGATWVAAGSLGTGELNIDSFTTSNASGRFTFTAVALQGTPATGSKVVTNGVFNVRFFAQP